ncbi:MAG: nitrilase-related carbon-nitrogen hydrolase [Dehalococcoidia bacterium]
MEQQSAATQKLNRLSFLWLALASILVLFSNGKWNIPVATWLSLVFALRFFRTQPTKRGFIVYTLVSIIPFYFAWQGVVPIPGIGYFIFVVMICLFSASIFLTDRLLAPHLKGFASTLVFPSAFVTMQYIMTLASPYGSFGSLAYTQYGNLPLLQILSVTGLSGVTFLLAWFASVVNWAWEQQLEWRKVWRGVVTYVGVLAVILIGGGASLISQPSSDATRIATILATQIFEMSQDIRNSLYRFLSGNVTETELKSIRAELNANIEDLFERSEREARAGARIVFWSEVAGYVLKEDELALIERGRTLASQEGIYLGMALATLSFGQRLFENKIVLIEPSGEVAWEYLKARPVPGENSLRGDGEILTLDTPYGKVAVAICFDMDFPDLIRQAGEAEVDLMFNPANDWKEVGPLRMRMATFRAIENGFSLIRPASNGFSVATDSHGQVLAITDYVTSEDPVMIAFVPTGGRKTIYSEIGDVFAWLCMAGLVTAIGRVAVRRKPAKSARKPAVSA